MKKDELLRLLLSDLKIFENDIKTARTEEFKIYQMGRIKEAEWILSKVGDVGWVNSNPTGNSDGRKEAQKHKYRKK